MIFPQCLTDWQAMFTKESLLNLEGSPITDGRGSVPCRHLLITACFSSFKSHKSICYHGMSCMGLTECHRSGRMGALKGWHISKFYSLVCYSIIALPCLSCPDRWSHSQNYLLEGCLDCMKNPVFGGLFIIIGSFPTTCNSKHLVAASE